MLHLQALAAALSLTALAPWEMPDPSQDIVIRPQRPRAVAKPVAAGAVRVDGRAEVAWSDGVLLAARASTASAGLRFRVLREPSALLVWVEVPARQALEDWVEVEVGTPEGPQDGCRYGVSSTGELGARCLRFGQGYGPEPSFDGAVGAWSGGWTAELRIPLEALGYEPSGDAWLLHVTRAPRDEVGAVSLEHGTGDDACATRPAPAGCRRGAPPPAASTQTPSG